MLKPSVHAQTGHSAAMRPARAPLALAAGLTILVATAGSYITHAPAPRATVQHRFASGASAQVTDTIVVGPDIAFHPSTVTIHVGDAVTWLFPPGSAHAVTSGHPCAADASPLFGGTSTFTYAFANAGTYGFLCTITGHCSAGMFGSVVVSTPTAVGSSPVQLGFVTPPWPNPSRSGVRFTYALTSPGHASAEVFDAQGRRVTTLVDGDLSAGTHSATWNDAPGSSPGLYYVRLRLPGYDETRGIVVRP